MLFSIVSHFLSCWKRIIQYHLFIATDKTVPFFSELRQDKPTTTQSSFLNRFKEIEKPQRKEPEFNHGKDKHYHKKKKQQKTEEEKQEVTTGLSKTDVKLVDTITWSINQSSHHKTNFDENNRSNEIGLPVMNICTFLVVLSVCFWMENIKTKFLKLLIISEFEWTIKNLVLNHKDLRRTWKVCTKDFM